MKLSVVVPIYNEDKTLEEIIHKIKAADIGKIEKEIIIVDDGSSDSTIDILKNKIEPIVDKIIYQQFDGN